MKPLDLRRPSSLDTSAGQLLRRWRRQGLQVCTSVPTPGRHYLACRGEGEHGPWTALIDPQQWLRHTLAELPGLVPQAIRNEATLALFNALPRPFESLVAELDYGQLPPATLVVSQPGALALLPCVTMPWGELWLTQWPSGAGLANGHRPPWLDSIPVALKLTLGQTSLTLTQWQALRCHDVLRLDVRTDALCLAGRALGQFILHLEGFTMQLTPDSTEPLAPFVDDLPIKVEFVLHRQTFTLAELSAMVEGQVIALPVDVHMSVNLLANGEPFATGELVQLDTGLGVEIQTLGRAAGGSVDDE